MSTTKISQAYGELVAKGETPTVRSLRAAAGVRTAEAAAWLREHAAALPDTVPDAPDLSEVAGVLVRSVWAAAWTKASGQAEDAVADALEAARRGEADALAAAEQAGAERDAAQDELAAAREQAGRDVAALRSEVASLRAQLERIGAELDAATEAAAAERARAQEADRARVRAESASDTLREVLDSLRGSATGRGD